VSESVAEASHVAGVFAGVVETRQQAIVDVQGTGGSIIYFSCEDCDETAAKAVAAGGKMQLEEMSIGEYGFISLVCDTEGNMI